MQYRVLDISARISVLHRVIPPCPLPALPCARLGPVLRSRRADAVRLPMGSKKRKAASTPSAAAAAPTEEARVAALQASMDALQSWLLAAGGTIHPSLRFGNDGNGGTGCFATRLIEAETDLFVVPRQCIISLDTVRESRLGRELCDAVGALDSELADEEATEIATWIFMVTGRCDTHTHAHTHAHTHMHARTLTCTCTYTNMHMHMRWRRRRDPQHGYHAYLASLPAVPDDVACWPAAHRGGGLEATPVAGEVQQAVDLAECPCFVGSAALVEPGATVSFGMPSLLGRMALGAGLLCALGRRARAAQCTSWGCCGATDSACQGSGSQHTLRSNTQVLHGTRRAPARAAAATGRGGKRGGRAVGARRLPLARLP